MASPRHTDHVCSTAYSPDGRHIISHSEDNTISILDATTGQAVTGPFREHTNHVLFTTYSPDGRHIVSASIDNIISVWDVITGQTVVGPL